MVERAVYPSRLPGGFEKCSKEQKTAKLCLRLEMGCINRDGGYTQYIMYVTAKKNLLLSNLTGNNAGPQRIGRIILGRIILGNAPYHHAYPEEVPATMLCRVCIII